MARTCVLVTVPEKLKVRPLTLYGLEGHLLRYNDAVFYPALPSSTRPSALDKQRTLVFFGGDIQNLSYLMDQTDDSAIDHRQWCLEETALRLGGQFPSCHVVVIKPSRVVFDHISCFDNFVESNIIGIPKHYYHYMALMHLEKLLKTISKTLREMDSDALFKMLLRTLQEEQLQEKYKIENGTAWQYTNMPEDRKRMLLKWQKELRLHKYPQTLMAFSKGCVVLNQFLYEFHYARGLEPNHVDSGFIDRIQDMYWLDSGNCGRRNVYLTSMGLLRTLVSLDIIVHVHASMYMTEDENRPWIVKQFNEFIDRLVELQGNVLQFRHVGANDDLESHFQVMLHFNNTERKHMMCINSPKVRRKRNLPPVLEEPAPLRASRVRARPRKQPGHSESTGFCLLNPHGSPHLMLKIAMQKPGFTLQATQARLSCPQYRNFVQYLPSRYRSRLSSSQMPSTSAEPSMPVETPSTLVQTTSSQMPSAPAEPSTSVQTPSTTVQEPSPSMEMWSFDLLPKNHENFTPLLLNELSYSLSEEEAVNYKNTSYCELIAPVVAIPNSRNPLRLHVFTPVKDIYVPSLINHHFVVNKKNDKDEGEDLPAYFVDEEPPPAADGLDPARATSSSNSMASRRSRNATGSVSLTPGPRADVSTDSDISDSASDDSVLDSNISGSASDVSNPDSDISGSADDDSNSDSDISGSADDVSNSDSDISGSADDNSNPESYVSGSASNVSNPGSYTSGSVDDNSASDSDFSSSSGTSSRVNSRIGPRSGLGHTPSLIDAISDVLALSSRVTSPSGLGSHSTRVTQPEPNTVADRSVITQRAIPRTAPIAQPNFSQNQVDTPRDPIYSHSTSSGSQVASSSQDSDAPRAGTSRARVRPRDVDHEPSCRYNLRKRIKRSYDENILHIQYQ